MMLGYDIRMEGEIKALFLHQAAPAGAALFLFLVAKIAVLLFAFIGLIFWDLEIPSRAGNLHAHTRSPDPPPTQAHTSHVCSLLPIFLQTYFNFIVYNSLIVYSKYFFYLCIIQDRFPRRICYAIQLYCYTQALFPFLKHAAEQLS